MKLLFDLFPIALFFAAYKLRGIFVATAVAIAATLVQIVWTFVRRRRVDPMLWTSLVIISVFGGATLVLRNEAFIKWKPTVLYWVFFTVLLGSERLFRKNLIQSMLKEQVDLSTRGWRALNLSWALFFLFLGGLNLYVATHFSTDAWVNFKLFGTTGLMLVFVLVQAVFLARHVEEKEP